MSICFTEFSSLGKDKTVMKTKLIFSLVDVILFFSCRLSIMVKRPPSCMSKTQELSQKIDFDSASITGENSPEFDDVDDFQDEFINIVMPLIKNGPDDSQSFRGCYNNVHFW
jgi:hypothetical protein